MQFARINGLSIHYQMINGPEGAPKIIFSNSLGTDFRIWRDVIVRLAGKAHILLYDKRGHGLSDLGDTPYVIDDHISDLSELMDHVGWQDAIVCGLSVGGLIAQGLYHSRPDLVRALILCDTAAKIGNEAMWNDRIEAIEAGGGVHAIADAILERWFTPAYRQNEKDAFAIYSNMLIRTPMAGYTGTGAAIRDADFTEDAGKIYVPTICIVGDQDGATPPELVEATAKLIPECRYQVIKDAGHLPCIEQPEVLHAIIEAFMDEFQLQREGEGEG